MSSNTKIVVLKMKELIYTAIFVALGIVLVLLLVFMFGSGNKKEKQAVPTYVAGVYTYSIGLGDNAVDVEVTVDESHINDVRLVNLNESITATYPLMEPAMEEIAQQVYENQSVEDVVCSEGNQYTGAVLLGGVEKALEKARVK